MGKAIKLDFSDFDVEDNSGGTCDFDYLEVRKTNKLLFDSYRGSFAFCTIGLRHRCTMAPLAMQRNWDVFVANRIRPA